MQISEKDDAAALNKARNHILNGHPLFIAADSNVFFEGIGKDRQVSFNRDWMNKFRGLAARGERLLMTSVWDVEIRRHFKKSIDSQVNIKIPRLARVESNKKAIDDLNNRASALRQEAGSLVEKEWDSVKASFNTELIPIASDPNLAAKIFTLWAKIAWPFESKKSDEFQDAFALLSLHEYIEKIRLHTGTTNASILVVTADSGCREFCKQTASLIPCSSIDAAVELLARRQEIELLAKRSLDLDKIFSDPSQKPINQLSQNFLETASAGFPPRMFTFKLNGQERSGWLRSCEINSALALPSGPRGSLVEVIDDQSDSVRVTGRLRLLLTITLSEPRYAEGTACPSMKEVLSNYKCVLDVEFNAGSYDGNWWGSISTIPQHLTASEH